MCITISPVEPRGPGALATWCARPAAWRFLLRQRRHQRRHWSVCISGGPCRVPGTGLADGRIWCLKCGQSWTVSTQWLWTHGFEQTHFRSWKAVCFKDVWCLGFWILVSGKNIGVHIIEDRSGMLKPVATDCSVQRSNGVCIWVGTEYLQFWDKVFWCVFVRWCVQTDVLTFLDIVKRLEPSWRALESLASLWLNLFHQGSRVRFRRNWGSVDWWRSSDMFLRVRKGYTFHFDGFQLYLTMQSCLA